MLLCLRKACGVMFKGAGGSRGKIMIGTETADPSYWELTDSELTAGKTAMVQTWLSECVRLLNGLICWGGGWQWDQDLSWVQELAF